MKNSTRWISAIMVATTLALGAYGCDNDDDLADEIEDAADEVEDKVD